MNSNFELRKSNRAEVYLVRRIVENTIQYNYGLLSVLEKWVAEDRSGTIWHSTFDGELKDLPLVLESDSAEEFLRLIKMEKLLNVESI